MDDVTLLQGDCLKVMAGLPDGSVDMVLCDLPYGVTACKWDTVIPLEPLWAHYRRLVKPNGAIVLTATQPFASTLVMSQPAWFRHEWIWQKSQGTGFLNAKRAPLREHESVLAFCKAQPVYHPQLKPGRPYRFGGDRGRGTSCYGSPTLLPTSSDGLHYPTTILPVAGGAQRDRVHPTQKPVALFAYLIRTYTNPGDTVLDNCIGSGTTAVACLQVGRRCIGIERDPAYFALAQQRVADAIPPLLREA